MEASFSASHPESGNAPRGVHSRHARGSLVGILTSSADKRGKLCGGKGCWLRGKVRWTRWPLLASSAHPGNAGGTGPGQGGESQHRYRAVRGKENSPVLVTQSTFVGGAEPATVFEHFLLMGSLLYLLTFPAWCVLGKGVWIRMTLSLLDSK